MDKRILKKLSFLFLAVFILQSCQDDEGDFGEIIAPTNVQMTFEIQGVDSTNPDGDGSGFVTFNASADDAISYKYSFGDGTDEIAASGVVTHRFTEVGVNTYTVVVNAIGVAGLQTSTSVDVTVFSSFEDAEAEEMLSGNLVGDSKTWYWASDVPVHVGLGPVEDDYGGGEFAWANWWNSIGTPDDSKACMYEAEYVFTRTEDGVTFEQTEGPAYIGIDWANEIGVEGEMCHTEDVAPDMYGVKTMSFFPSTSKAALEGTYNVNGSDVPYRGTSFRIDNGGIFGWNTGTDTYDIIYVSDDILYLRKIQGDKIYDNGGFAWYHIFTSSPPGQKFESQYTNLVWSDEFEVDGAPNPANWTYDLGDGSGPNQPGSGWGNGEAQVYTDNAENIVVENDLLKITAKADGSGGYTSARIKTEDLFEFTYGRVEIKAKLPDGGGTWPALWMLGEDYITNTWPACGEIDIMEHAGNNLNHILGTLHYPEVSPGSGDGNSITIENATTEFHVYTLEWTPDVIKILVDGDVYHSIPNTASLPFESDMFLIMNVAMGGSIGGVIDTNFLEATMEIDYIRVFQ